MRLYAVRKRLDVTRNMPWQIRDYSRAPVFTTRLIITYLDSDQPSEKSSAETTSRTQEAHHIDVVAAHSLRQGQAALLLGIHRLPKPYCQQQQRQTAPKYIAAKPVMDSNDEDKDVSSTSHSPVFSRPRKTTTRPKKPASTNTVGAAYIQGVFV